MITTNKRANINFVVAAAAQTALRNAADAGSSIINGTNVRLNNGQLGFVADSIYGTVALNTLTDATPTMAEAPVLAIYAGNANSADVLGATATYPLWVRPYERTGSIDGRNEVVVTKQAYRAPTHSTWVLGNTAGQTNAVNVEKLTEYALTIATRGRRVEEMYSGQQAAATTFSYTTPDFTTLGYTEAQGRSVILNNIAWQINRNSYALGVNSRFPANGKFVAFLVASAGGAGTAIGTGSPITTGTVIPVVNTATGVRNITLTSAMATSIKNAIVAATGTAIGSVAHTILTVDLATASVVSPAAADMLVIMALDEKTAYVDLIPEVKVRLDIGLLAGFNYTTVRNAEYEQADEGQGVGRTLDLLYKATEGQRKYWLSHTEVPVIEFPSPIDTTLTYVTYNIRHGFNHQADYAHTIYQPLQETILIPSTNTTLVTNFDAALNNWLSSAQNNNAIIALD